MVYSKKIKKQKKKIRFVPLLQIVEKSLFDAISLLLRGMSELGTQNGDTLHELTEF